ncbi:hypothetical protein C8R47DRAFT_1214734 [Mycena vitilis]|nr:hypothetical protein C8R47DRAFT_1214734 [Mycena vitilis]
MSETNSSAAKEEEEPKNGRRHPKLYFSDGTAIFRLTYVEDGVVHRVLYNLHPGVLSSRSVFYNSLFSLPRTLLTSADVLTEGRTDDNPIELPSSIGRSDFDNILIYLYSGPSAYPKTDAFLISVMKMSAYWEIADGTEYAIDEFTRRGTKLDPALQFQLGRCFGLDLWVRCGFRRLMGVCLDKDLDFFQVSQIGLEGYFWLAKTKAKLQNLRNTAAFGVPPVVNCAGCESPEACVFAWNREWVESVRQLLHHPTQPIDCLDLLDQLRNIHIDGLCDGCQDLTVTWLWGKDLLTQEEDIIDEAVAALMAIQQDEPVRASVVASIPGASVSLGV